MCDVSKFCNRQINSTIRYYTGGRDMCIEETGNQNPREQTFKKECYNQRQRGKGVLK